MNPPDRSPATVAGSSLSGRVLVLVAGAILHNWHIGSYHKHMQCWFVSNQVVDVLGWQELPDIPLTNTEDEVG